MVKFLSVTSPSEIDRVAALARVTWSDHYTSIIGSAQVEYMLDKFQDETAIQAQIAEGYNYFILQVSTEDAGYFSYLLNHDDLFLSKIYILNELQGHGLGSAALDFIKEKAGFRRVWLTVNKMNSDSIAFYKKNDFIIADEVVTDIGEGFVMDDFVMELSGPAVDTRVKNGD